MHYLFSNCSNLTANLSLYHCNLFKEAETSRSLKNLEAEKPPVPFTQEILDEMSEEVESTLDEEEDKESLFAGDEEFLGDEEEEEYDPDATWIKTMENFNELEDESEFGPTEDYMKVTIFLS